MIFAKPRAIDSVMARRRAEVPYPWFAVAGNEAIPDQLVARPLTDNGARNVADIVLVEDQHRAEVGVCQRLARACEAVTMQPLEVDTLFEVHLRDARRLEWTMPAMRRVEIALIDRSELRFLELLRHVVLCLHFGNEKHSDHRRSPQAELKCSVISSQPEL